ncbi:hypothetical protein TNCV_2408111 [Trichonephila clavipes]|nr:hypothetical protein TNCV_2408111 [Trichonephila clavipes]
MFAKDLLIPDYFCFLIPPSIHHVRGPTWETVGIWKQIAKLLIGSQGLVINGTKIIKISVTFSLSYIYYDKFMGSLAINFTVTESMGKTTEWNYGFHTRLPKATSASCKRLLSWFLLIKDAEPSHKVVPFRHPKF